MTKARVLWISDGVVPTGFSRVAHSILKYLDKDKYEIHFLAVNYFGDPHPYTDLKIYPAYLKGDIYGMNRLQDFAQLNFDIIFILNDAWIQDVYLDMIKKTWKDKKLPKIITYTPVDATGHDLGWYKHFDVVTIPVVYTEFGKNEINGLRPDLKLRIIPHGIDHSVFYKIDKSKQEIKKELLPDKPDLYEDSFIVLNASRNQPRKRIDVSLKGFALFSQDKPLNVKFYYHGGVVDSFADITKLAIRYGIDNRMIVTNFNTGPQKVSNEKLNLIYNAADVGLNTSLGEGWGLNSMEHAITGAPQIVPDHSACKELYRDCGVLLPVSQYLVLDTINTEGGLVRPEEVANALDFLYKNREVTAKLGQLGMEKFSSDSYNWETIAKQWEALFDEVLDATNNISD